MPKFNPELLAVLSSHITGCSAIKALDDKHDLNLFSLLTPGMITAINQEVNIDPFILSQAISLIETTSILSNFYGEESLVKIIISELIISRMTWRESNKSIDASAGFLQKALMEEYFITEPNEMLLFLNSNPIYLGLYIYVFVRTVVMG